MLVGGLYALLVEDYGDSIGDALPVLYLALAPVYWTGTGRAPKS